MKIQLEEWEHVIHVDGEERERSKNVPNIKLLCEKYNARFVYNSALQHRPEVVYKFRTREEKGYN